MQEVLRQFEMSRTADGQKLRQSLDIPRRIALKKPIILLYNTWAIMLTKSG
jgi:hypothetical protein